MIAKKLSTGESEEMQGQEKKGRVKVDKLAATRELSADGAKKVKGGTDFNFVHSYDKASPVLLTSDPKK